MELRTRLTQAFEEAIFEHYEALNRKLYERDDFFKDFRVANHEFQASATASSRLDLSKLTKREREAVENSLAEHAKEMQKAVTEKLNKKDTLEKITVELILGRVDDTVELWTPIKNQDIEKIEIEPENLVPRSELCKSLYSHLERTLRNYDPRTYTQEKRFLRLVAKVPEEKIPGLKKDLIANIPSEVKNSRVELTILSAGDLLYRTVEERVIAQPVVEERLVSGPTSVNLELTPSKTWYDKELIQIRKVREFFPDIDRRFVMQTDISGMTLNDAYVTSATHKDRAKLGPKKAGQYIKAEFDRKPAEGTRPKPGLREWYDAHNITPGNAPHEIEIRLLGRGDVNTKPIYKLSLVKRSQ